MECLRFFDNYNEYLNAKNTLTLPCTSYLYQEDEIMWNPWHYYVDLGLPSGTKWATMNVGANSVTDYGDYFQWGKGDKPYTVTSGESAYDGTASVLPASADTATQVWGGGWHMPTKTQFVELYTNTTITYYANYEGTGKVVYELTSKNDATKSILLPAGGYWNFSNSTITGIGNYPMFWGSSAAQDSDVTKANRIYYHSKSQYNVADINRNYGCTVRPVLG